MSVSIFDFIISLAHQLGLFAMLVVVFTSLTRKLEAVHEFAKQAAIGLVFGVGGLAAMLDPIDFTQGVILDSRSVMIALSAPFGGPIATLVTTSILVIFRLFLGGVGAIPAVLSALSIAALSLGAVALLNRSEIVRPVHLSVLGLLAACVSPLWLFLLPDGIGTFTALALPMVVINFTGIMVLGTVLNDIRQRWKLEHDLAIVLRNSEAATTAAENASRAKGEFLAVMSHEIRTPLSGIKGFAEILSDTKPLTVEQHRYLKLINAATRALSTVVNDILDFSRIEAGQVSLYAQRFSPAALVHDAVSIVGEASTKKHLDVTVTIDPSIPAWVHGDSDRIRQVLLNLVNNAIKFTERGGVAITAKSIGYGELGTTIEFSIRDTGTGIPSDRLPLLFNRFVQADSSIRRRFGGTGLGLAISKSLVEAMDGTIGVDSREGEGSNFWFCLTLPVAEAPQFEGADAEGVTPVHRGAKLLLVEDVDVNQEIAVTFLTDVGYSVDAVSSGLEAIESVNSKAYDLILMDIQMPGMDGMEATARIRAGGGQGATLPILAMTANVIQDEVARFKAAGMDDHIGKPFDRKMLVAMIEKWLASPRSPQVQAERPEPAERPFLDRECFDKIGVLMGPQKFPAMLARFEAQLTSRLAAIVSAPNDWAAARRDAHALASSADMLGFARLAQACRDLEAASGDDPSFVPLLNRCRALRDSVVTELRQLGETLEQPAAVELAKIARR